MMTTEIEAKLKVDSFDQITAKLQQLGAEFIEEQLQLDSYFDHSGHLLKKSGRGFRLRQQETSSNKKAILTYKGAKEKHKFKKREEIEVEVLDFDAAERIVLAIGFEKIVNVEKKRNVWKLNDCEVALDEVKMLGCFVEIEGPDESRISQVQNMLELSDLTHVEKSYSHMIKDKLAE